MALCRGKIAHTFLRQIEKVEKLRPAERRFLRRALDLDDSAAPGHDEVGIRLGVAVLGVVEVEDGDTLIEAAGNGGDLICQRNAFSMPSFMIRSQAWYRAT